MNRLPVAVVLTQDKGQGGSYTFPVQFGSYISAGLLDITVTNYGSTGTGPLTFNVSPLDFNMGSYNHSGLAPDASFTIPVTPNGGLTNPNYTSIIEVVDSSMTTLASFEVRFSVTGTGRICNVHCQLS